MLKYIGRFNLGRLQSIAYYECTQCGTRYPSSMGRIWCNGEPIDDCSCVSRETLKGDAYRETYTHDDVSRETPDMHKASQVFSAAHHPQYALAVEACTDGLWHEVVIELTTCEALALKGLLESNEPVARSLLFKLVTGVQTGMVGRVRLQRVPHVQ